MPNDIANNMADTIHQLEKELKNLREENKVLMQECDRLIKEKGELLSKVSGGDVLRICQLEDRLQVELDNSHCLEIELAEAKWLLKVAVEDMSEENFCTKVRKRDNFACRVSDTCDFKWRFVYMLGVINNE